MTAKELDSGVDVKHGCFTKGGDSASSTGSSLLAKLQQSWSSHACAVTLSHQTAKSLLTVRSSNDPLPHITYYCNSLVIKLYVGDNKVIPLYIE